MANAFTILRTADSAAPEVTLSRTNPRFNEATRLPRFKIRGVEYMLKSEVAVSAKKSSRERSSAIWRFGEALVRMDNKKEVYYCWECENLSKEQKLPILAGNQGALYHMEHTHRRDPKTGLKKGATTAAVEDREPSIFELVDVKNFSRFKELLIHWFVFCQMAFFMLENAYFRELITYLNTGLGALLPAARSTLRGWIMAEFARHKEKLVAQLLERQSKVHLSFDIWTAGSYIGIISIWGYWIDRNGKRQRRLLAFRRIYGSHSGDNQKDILLDVIAEYRLAEAHGVGYFVSDNHPANDSAVRLVLKQLYPLMSVKAIKSRSLRCFGHIVNLCAQSLLAASNAETKKAAMDLELDLGEFKKRAKGWIAAGPLGKVHWLVKYILASSQRREEFGDIKGGRKVADYDHLGLLSDNATRWNSWFRALSRVLNVKERLTKFIKQHVPSKQQAAADKYYPQQDRLTPNDWIVVERIHTCLETFYAATKTTEGSSALLCEWFPTLHHLLTEVDGWKQEAMTFLKNDYLTASMIACWNKVEKYYKLVDETPVYYAAVVLNPTLKMEYFKDQWASRTEEQQRWIPWVESMVRELWRNEYKGPDLQRRADEGARSGAGEDTPFSRLANAKRLKQKPTQGCEPVDQFELYIQTDPVDYDDDRDGKFDVLAYWQERRITQPALAQFAFDVLSIPLMSDDNERSFSSGRDMVTYRRTNLHGDIIEACQCLKSWLAPLVDRKNKVTGSLEPVFDSEEALNVDYEAAEAEAVIAADEAAEAAAAAEL